MISGKKKKKAGFLTFLAGLWIRNLLNILSHTPFLFYFYLQMIRYQSDPLPTVSPSSSLAADRQLAPFATQGNVALNTQAKNTLINVNHCNTRMVISFLLHRGQGDHIQVMVMDHYQGSV